MILFTLFIVFFRIGLFAIGGAYSFIPLLEKEIVEKHQWLTKNEFLEVLGMVKVFPGAISIKYATYTGNKIAGLWGIIVANVGNFLAPVLLIVGISKLYMKYKDIEALSNSFKMIQIVAFSLIIAAAFKLIPVKQLTNFWSLVVIVLSFILFMYTKIHPALIIVVFGLLGLFIRL